MHPVIYQSPYQPYDRGTAGQPISLMKLTRHKEVMGYDAGYI